MRLALVAFVLTALAAPASAGNFGNMTMVLQKKPGVAFNDLERKEFFNQVACECHETFYVQMELIGEPAALPDTNVEIWVGSNCATFETTRADRCTHLSTLDRPISDFKNQVNLPVDAAKLMFPTQQGCPAISGENTVWALIDEGANQTYDNIWSLSPTITYDSKPPEAPTAVTASGVEDAVRLSWKLPSSVTDIRGFQVLCADQDDAPIFDKPVSSAEYHRTEDVTACTVSAADAGVAGADAGAADGGVAAKPPQTAGDFAAADPAFICSGLLGNTSTSARIDLGATELQALRADPQKCVKLEVVVLDEARNYQLVAASDCVRPQDVRDGWEVYHDDAGAADGGFCFVATAVYGDYDHPYVKVLRRFRDQTLATFDTGRAFIRWYYASSPPWADFLRAHQGWRVAAAVALFPVVALAWLWNLAGGWGVLLLVAAAVLWRRRRRARRLRLAAAGAVVAAVLAAAGSAHAQAYLDERGEPEDTIQRSRWGFEIELGPYYPDIDGESGLTGTPFADTYGTGKVVLVGMELDYFILNRIGGELGVGASIGYTSKSGYAFKVDPATGLRTSERSQDETTFRLVPMALSAVYRFTELADRTVIPLVPYAKLGLSYYVWQFTKGNGDVSKVGNDQGRGGTLGWQTTIGLALRADRLDESAARSLRSDLGVEHAGFFGELTYADVSGLGASHKLRVGDLTWSAGINFEF